MVVQVMHPLLTVVYTVSHLLCNSYTSDLRTILSVNCEVVFDQ